MLELVGKGSVYIQAIIYLEVCRLTCMYAVFELFLLKVLTCMHDHTYIIIICIGKILQV